MGRELRRKQAKKDGKSLEKVEINYENQFKKYLLNVFIIVGVFAIIYLLTGSFITKEFKWFNKDKEDVTPSNGVTNAILASAIFSQSDESYYVYFYDFDEKEKDSSITTTVNNKLIGMYNINNIPKDYKYYIQAEQINSNIKDFSLSEIFNNDVIFDKKKGFNAVTIISRTQTISRFNETKFNGMKGSGYHDTNFEEILKVIYGREFTNNTTGQDIMIRYATYEKNDGSLLFNMLLSIPLAINSTQRVSLENLNNEIKNLEYYLGEDIHINISVVDYNTQSYSKYYNDQTNLDNVLNELIINDDISDKYEEVCFIGYSNLDNHYKKVSYVR